MSRRPPRDPLAWIAAAPDDEERARRAAHLLSRLAPLERDEVRVLTESALSRFRYALFGDGQKLVTWLVDNTNVDIIYFGGEPGAGKTHLALVLAATRFRQSIFFRRHLRDITALDGPEDRSRELFSTSGVYRADRHRWALKIDGVVRRLQFDGMANEADKEKHRGNPRDLYVFDEAPQFTESQVRFPIAWRRTKVRGQRTLVLLTGNPPTDEAGEWVILWLAPWVDPTFAHPALPGEIRWVVLGDSPGDLPTWVDGPGPHAIRGKTVRATSITFVPSRLAENPVYADGSYARVIAQLPEPMRSQLQTGNFMAGRAVDAWQVIRPDWVRLAQARWQTNPLSRLPESERLRLLGPCDQLGADIAYGGADRTTIAARWKSRIDVLDTYDGRQTPTGPAAAEKILWRRALAGGGSVLVDANGFGAAAAERVREAIGDACYPVMVGASTTETDRTRLLRFANVRTLLWWNAHEFLNPENGHDVELPPHPQLAAELCAARWKVKANGDVAIDAKEIQKERIGRSPDLAEAVLLSLLEPTRLPRDLAARWAAFVDADLARIEAEREAAKKEREAAKKS